jgi:hypothetical protein
MDGQEKHQIRPTYFTLDTSVPSLNCVHNVQKDKHVFIIIH